MPGIKGIPGQLRSRRFPGLLHISGLRSQDSRAKKDLQENGGGLVLLPKKKAADGFSGEGSSQEGTKNNCRKVCSMSLSESILSKQKPKPLLKARTYLLQLQSPIPSWGQRETPSGRATLPEEPRNPRGSASWPRSAPGPGASTFTKTFAGGV